MNGFSTGATARGARPTVIGSLAAGALHGALFYGSVISLLHVIHGRVPSVWNASVLFVASNLLYGAAAAAAFLAVAVAASLVARLGRRAPASPPGLRIASFAFTLGFWFFATNYGLTYDEVPWGRPAGPLGMLAWLALRTAAVAAAGVLVAWLFARLWGALARPSPARKWTGAAWAALFAAHVGLAAAWAPPVRPEAPLDDLPRPDALRPPVKVVLVAADGADWRVVRPLMAAGEMPNLARLVELGVHGSLETLPGSNSAVIWASIYSGLEPSDHGVLDFYTVRVAGMTEGVFPVHRTGFKELAGYLESLGLAERQTVDRSSLRAPLFWEVASALGRSIGVVDGYYYSYPAPPLPAEAVALGAPAGEGRRPGSFYLAYGTDRFYQRAARGRRPPAAAPGAEEYARPPELLDELGETLTGWEFVWQSESLLRLLETYSQPDLVSFYSHQPDAVQHWHWRAYEPALYLGVSAREVAERADEIPAFHRDLDRFLGQLLERLDPGTVVILASDHGHSPTLLHSMDTQHRHGPPGILVMAGGPVRSGGRLDGAHVYDLYPTVLRLLGLPVPESADGRVLEEAFDPGFVAAFPGRTVPSYDALLPAFLPVTGERTGEEARREEELEKLKALGYVR